MRNYQSGKPARALPASMIEGYIGKPEAQQGFVGGPFKAYRCVMDVLYPVNIVVHAFGARMFYFSRSAWSRQKFQDANSLFIPGFLPPVASVLAGRL